MKTPRYKEKHSLTLGALIKSSFTNHILLDWSKVIFERHTECGRHDTLTCTDDVTKTEDKGIPKLEVVVSICLFLVFLHTRTTFNFYTALLLSCCFALRYSAISTYSSDHHIAMQILMIITFLVICHSRLRQTALYQSLTFSG